MKAIKNMLYIAAMATAITACTSEDALAPELNTPLTVSATIPGDVWAVASRSAEGEDPSSGSSPASRAPQYSAWTLHYTNYQGHAATYSPSVTVTDGVASFTTGDDLVWAKIDATQPIHLTCVTDNGTDDTSDDYTLHVSVASATPRQTLAFGAMKPVVAKLTVKFTLENNMNLAPEPDEFSMSFSAKGKREASGEETAYDPRTDKGVWPVGETSVTSFSTLTGISGTDFYTVTGTILLPEQTLGNELTVTYGSYTWTADLSQVEVKNTNPVQYANQLKAGQHLTLNLKTSITSLNAPNMNIEAEAFTPVNTGYENALGGVVGNGYTVSEDGKTYTVYNLYGFEAWKKAFETDSYIDVNVAFNSQNSIIELTDAIIAKYPVTDETTWKDKQWKGVIVGNTGVVNENGNKYLVIDGSATTEDIAARVADFYENTNVTQYYFYVKNQLRAYESGTSAKTTLGQFIKSVTGYYVNFHIILADAESIPDKAFYNCGTLLSVSLPKARAIGEESFYFTGITEFSSPKATTIGAKAFGYAKVTELSLPNATTIGNGAFDSCTDLDRVSIPEAETIEANAFHNTKVTEVSLPKATTIGAQAFSNCQKLIEVLLPKATTIGANAFNNCQKLIEVSIPEATTIGNGAFSSCSVLKTVYAPSVRSLENCAFQRCVLLTSVSMENLETIGQRAFEFCSGLESIALPSVNSIGDNAFSSCSKLKRITFSTVIKDCSTDAFNGGWTEYCDLILAEGQMGPSSTLKVSLNINYELQWGNAPWKSIKVGTTEYVVVDKQLTVKK